MKKLAWFSLVVVLCVFWSPVSVGAQQELPKGPVYIVQSGDTLGAIARRFNVSLDALVSINSISNPNLLAEGDPLVIPGLEGVEGVLTTVTVPFGETLDSLGHRYQIPSAMLVRLNHLTSPAELFAGANLIITQTGKTPPALKRAVLAPGGSLLELAVRTNANPWEILRTNNLTSSWNGLAGDVLLAPGDPDNGPGGLPPSITSLEIQPLPVLQGKTVEIYISAAQGATFSGTFMDRPINFFHDGDGYRALVGIHALAEPGFYPLSLKQTDPAGQTFQFSQLVGVSAVEYPFDLPLTVDAATIDPSVTLPEDAEWTALAATATPDRLWDGLFLIPSPLPQDYCLETGECWTSRYGNRRSYNGSPYAYFHTGLDIAGGTGTEIFAPAAGVVIFAGPLTVRGNATMINHGWGVYTGYMHQSEILVKAGDRIKPGQLIGRVGGTGRVEGPHLHFEVWVGGVQVDPLDWLGQVYP